MQNRTAIFGLLLLFRKFQTICPLPYTWHLLSYRLQSLLAVSPDLPLQIIFIQSHEHLMSKKLEHEFEILANSLKSGDASNQELSIPALAERIAKTLHVKSDEVAIFAVSEKWRHLCFLVPQALRNVGHIPLSSSSALAARTVRDSRRKSSIISRRFVTPAFSKASRMNR